MRKDMAKVLAERPRYYRYGVVNKKLRRRKDEEISEDAPKMEGMKRGWVRCRERNENLRPLRRYLYSQVGRLWNDVNRDIHRWIKTSNPAHSRWLNNIRFYVSQEFIWKNGEPHDLRKGEKLPNVFSQALFFVHPETGVLHALRQNY